MRNSPALPYRRRTMTDTPSPEAMEAARDAVGRYHTWRKLNNLQRDDNELRFIIALAIDAALARVKELEDEIRDIHEIAAGADL